MDTNINISLINSSNTDVYVQPQDKREHDENFNSSRLNLTWIIDSYKNETMTMNLTFNFPFEISPDDLEDRLVIYFNQSKSLITCQADENSSGNLTRLNESSRTMSLVIPKQLTKSYITIALQQATSFITESTINLMIIGIIFGLIGNGCKDKWIVFVRSL